jgi:hypothetical protein
MSDQVCISCRRPKAVLSCEVCHEALCKSCAQFLEATTFSFYKEVPEVLTHTYYCSACHSEHVEPALESYQEIMERARSVYFFFNTQRKLVPIIKRSKESVRVESCVDRNETILRLAFLAAQQGFNGIVDAEVNSKKIRNEGYEKSEWQGVGFPAEVDAKRMERW